MARRQQSKEAAILESVIGLAGLVVFLLVFSPNFRPWTQLLMAFLVMILFGWVVYNVIREKSPSPPFGAFSFNPRPTEKPISKPRPTGFVEESQKGRPMNGNQFLGCSTFPRCRFIMNLEVSNTKTCLDSKNENQFPQTDSQMPVGCCRGFILSACKMNPNKPTAQKNCGNIQPGRVIQLK